MQVKLTISSDASFILYLMPETAAERDILRRVAENKELVIMEKLRDSSWPNRPTDSVEITASARSAGAKAIKQE